MKRRYNVGLGAKKIFLAVSVGTPGVACTVANQFRSGGQRVKLAESSSDSGNIPLTPIGSPQSLRDSYLIVQTIIDFGTIDPKQWAQLSQNLVIRYHLSGGFSGNQYFNSDSDDVTVGQSGKLLVVTKPIELI